MGLKVHFITLYAFGVPLGVFSVVTMFALAAFVLGPLPSGTWSTRIWNLVFTGFFLLVLEIEAIRREWLTGTLHALFVEELPRFVDLVATERVPAPTR